MTTNENGLTFDAWLEECNAWLRERIGISTLEIADWDWWYGWNDGMSPEDAAREAFASDDIGSMFTELLDGGE
jgi:hypothetical protein